MPGSLVAPGATSESNTKNLSKMRTAAAVWADKRDAVEAEPEAEVPTRGCDLGNHNQSMMR